MSLLARDSDYHEQDCLRSLRAVLSSLEHSPSEKARLLDLLIRPHREAGRTFSFTSPLTLCVTRYLLALDLQHSSHPDFTVAPENRKWLETQYAAYLSSETGTDGIRVLEAVKLSAELESPYQGGFIAYEAIAELIAGARTATSDALIPEGTWHYSVVDGTKEIRKRETLSADKITLKLGEFERGCFVLNYTRNRQFGQMVHYQDGIVTDFKKCRTVVFRFLEWAALTWLVSDSFDPPAFDLTSTRFKDIQSRGTKIMHDCNSTLEANLISGIKVEKSRTTLGEPRYLVIFAQPVVVIGTPTKDWLANFLRGESIAAVFPEAP